MKENRRLTQCMRKRTAMDYQTGRENSGDATSMKSDRDDEAKTLAQQEKPTKQIQRGVEEIQLELFWPPVLQDTRPLLVPIVQKEK